MSGSSDIGMRLFLLVSMIVLLATTIALAFLRLIPSESVTAILTGLVFVVVRLLESQYQTAKASKSEPPAGFIGPIPPIPRAPSVPEITEKEIRP